MAKTILWLGIVFIMIDALTWFWDCFKYKVWNMKEWSKHLKLTVNGARKEFKHELHKKIYYAMMIMLLALELVPYTLLGWEIASTTTAKLAVILLIAIAVTNTVRNIVIIGTKSDKTLKLVTEDKIAVITYSVLVTGLSVYGLGISIYKILNTVGLV